MISVHLSRDKVRNGERLSGTVSWRAEGSKTPRKIEALCRWRTEGSGTKSGEVVCRVEQANLEGRNEVTIPVQFDIPREGPLSYDGKVLRIIWEVVANADLPMARDEHDVKTFTVVARKWDAEEWVKSDDETDEDEDDDEEDDDEEDDDEEGSV